MHLAVETKVDSDVSRNQLVANAHAPHRGVLLALGVSASQLTSEDLAGDLDDVWAVCNPARWEQVLRCAGVEEDPVLAPYLAQVNTEAGEHAAAVELAATGALWLDHSRVGDGELEHYSWLEAIRDAYGGDRWDWWCDSRISGPLLGLWRDEFQRSGARDIFLQFVCGWGKRELCLKVGGGDGDIRQAAQAARERIGKLGWRVGRNPATTAGTCTAAAVDLTGADPRAAADQVRAAVHALET